QNRVLVPLLIDVFRPVKSLVYTKIRILIIIDFHRRQRRCRTLRKNHRHHYPNILKVFHHVLCLMFTILKHTILYQKPDQNLISLPGRFVYFGSMKRAIWAPFSAVRSYSAATRTSCPVGYPLPSGALVHIAELCWTFPIRNLNRWAKICRNAAEWLFSPYGL